MDIAFNLAYHAHMDIESVYSLSPLERKYIHNKLVKQKEDEERSLKRIRRTPRGR